MIKEGKREEIEKILILLGECFLEHDTSEEFFKFLSNVVILRRDPFFIENDWVIKKLEEFLGEAKNNKK
jgi:hypothetical protein